MIARRSLLAAVVTAAIALAITPRAHAEVIERVVAVVNDEAIFLSELRRRAIPFLAQALEAASEEQRMQAVEQVYRQVLDGLVEDRLITQAARDMDVRVSRDDVDRAIDNVRRQNQLSEREFWDAVRAQGFTESQYRSDVRSQLLRLKVLNQRARGRVNLTEEDVRRRYDRETRGASRTLRYRLSHVFFGVPPDASATDVATIRERADAVRSELDADGFEAAIAAHAGGELGWLNQGDLPEALEQAVVDLEAGQISPVVRGPSGFHILLLHEKERGAAGVPPFDEVRDQLYRAMLEEAMSRQQRILLDELKRRAVVTLRL